MFRFDDKTKRPCPHRKQACSLLDVLDDLATTTPVPEAQIILYDDVVVATERIGCKVP